VVDAGLLAAQMNQLQLQSSGGHSGPSSAPLTQGLPAE